MPRFKVKAVRGILPGTFAGPFKSGQKERAETTQRKNTRFGHSGHSGAEFGEGLSSECHQTPIAAAILLPEVVKAGSDSRRAIHPKTGILTRGDV